MHTHAKAKRDEKTEKVDFGALSAPDIESSSLEDLFLAFRVCVCVGNCRSVAQKSGHIDNLPPTPSPPCKQLGYIRNFKAKSTLQAFVCIK